MNSFIISNQNNSTPINSSGLVYKSKLVGTPDHVYDITTPDGLFNYIQKMHDSSDNSMSDEKKEKIINQILAKLKSGKKLTSKELSILREYDPQLYMRALRIQQMAEELKNSLSHVSSKEEANDKINSAFLSISENDPDKEFIIAAYNRVVKDFKKSPGYSRLPNKIDKNQKNKPRPAVKFKSDEENNDFDDEYLRNWTPLQEIIDSAPKLEIQGWYVFHF